MPTRCLWIVDFAIISRSQITKNQQNILKFYIYKQSKMHTCCSSGKVANIALVNAA